MADSAQKSAISASHDTLREGTISQKADEGEALDKETRQHEFDLRSTMVILGAALSLFCTLGFINAFGVFLDYYHQNLLSHKTPFEISWIGSFATFILMLGAPVAGVLVDKTGPLVLLAGGSTFLLFAIFMISLCTEYYQFFLAQGLVAGLSMSFLFTPALATVSRYFVRHRSLALGITVSGSSIGGVIWPIMLDQLLNSDGISFGWTIRIVGFTMLPLLIIACITVRSPRTSPQPDASNADAVQESKGHKTDLSIAKSFTFQLMCVGLAIGSLGLFSPFFYVTSYAKSLGMSASMSFYLVSIINGASLFGRVLPGFLADRFGCFNLCSMAILTSGIIALCWTEAENVAGLIIWSAAYGFASGAIMSLQTACAAQLSTHETHGTALGLVMFSVSLTGLFGTPISGELIKYGYLALSMFAGATLVVGAMFLFWSRVRQSPKIIGNA